MIFAIDSLRSRLPELLSPAAASEFLESHLAEYAAAPAAALTRLKSYLPDLRFVRITRENMVAQAISHFRALRTGLWYQPKGEGALVSGEPAPEFDFNEIHFCYCVGRLHEEQWRRFFAEHDISPHHVVYEELVTDFAAVVRGILEFIDIRSERLFIPPPRSRKLSDGVSAEWEDRYRALCAEHGFAL